MEKGARLITGEYGKDGQHGLRSRDIEAGLSLDGSVSQVSQPGRYEQAVKAEQKHSPSLEGKSFKLTHVAT